MRARNKHPHFAEFASFYAFELDDFQVKACHHLEDGASVLVAAPTGSGKTLVGEFAVHLALAAGRKCFYTTPIKALSNQKFNDLVERYGAENVGLLTGDNTINGDAPVVVMTTEVLRNMLYAGSSTLGGLAFVVMDEVHYLADRSRGAVWEEVIIHLPESVALVALSATVSNAEEFGDWLATVRGETVTVVEEKRPVPLFQHVMVGRRLFDLFADEADASAEAKVNPELVKIARDEWASTRFRDRPTPRGRNPRGKNIGNGRRVWIPSRPEMVERLDAAGLLPAIDFIFSRVGCDAAVEQCLAANVRLTTPAERDAIYEFVEAQCAHLPDEDLHVLGYHEFLDGLTRGVAAHTPGAGTHPHAEPHPCWRQRSKIKRYREVAVHYADVVGAQGPQGRAAGALGERGELQVIEARCRCARILELALVVECSSEHLSVGRGGEAGEGHKHFHKLASFHWYSFISICRDGFIRRIWQRTRRHSGATPFFRHARRGLISAPLSGSNHQ